MPWMYPILNKAGNSWFENDLHADHVLRFMNKVLETLSGILQRKGLVNISWCKESQYFFYFLE